MHFALVGDDPDGMAMACALADSGRHAIAAYTTPPAEPILRQWADARQFHDLEEVLADPAIEAVIVAGTLAYRPAQLRRAVQSERHVLCVHPPASGPEPAYEAGLMRDDTGCVLLPLLHAGWHPAVRRLAEFSRPQQGPSPTGSFILLEGEWAASGEVLLSGDDPLDKPAFPVWDLLRALGGEVQEVWGYAEKEEVDPVGPILVSGRFEAGGLFRITLLPNQPADRLSLAVIGSAGRAELLFPVGPAGPAFLNWEQAGETVEESWLAWDPWPGLVEAFERALEGNSEAPTPSWADAIRALELDDAVRRSIARRRASLLEYPEAGEEASFKGTMTLVGCGMLWAILVLLLLSLWAPGVRWLIVPLLAVFLVLQLLRYLIPERKPDEPAPPDERITRA
jgi:predicted dehydrogenase